MALQEGSWTGGFYYDARTGFFYSTEENDDSPLWRYTVDDFSPVGTAPVCVDPFLVAGPDNDPDVGEQILPNSGLFGITTDEDGNIYIVNGMDNQRSRIIKYSPNGEFIAASPFDETDNDPSGVNEGWFSARGIVYSETSQQLYVSTTSRRDDCVYRFDRDVNPLGFAVPPNGDLAAGNPNFGQAKGIAINVECCPTEPNQVVSVVECFSGSSEVIFLNEIFPCDGIICEAQWTPVGTASTDIYESCDQSLQSNGPRLFHLYPNLSRRRDEAVWTIHANLQLRACRITVHFRYRRPVPELRRYPRYAYGNNHRYDPYLGANNGVPHRTRRRLDDYPRNCRANFLLARRTERNHLLPRRAERYRPG